MTLFPRTGDFAPLFRLLDDYDLHRSGRSGQASSSSGSISSFAPRFDVRESKDAYHLDGELPGIAQKDIEIEFSDPQTLNIKGRAVREYHSGNADNETTPKPASVEDEAESSETAVQKSSDKKEVSKSGQHHFKYWVSERSVGEFHRSFNFPSRVDQDGVKASLKNGVLSVVVPKAAPPTSRKISIE